MGLRLYVARLGNHTLAAQPMKRILCLALAGTGLLAIASAVTFTNDTLIALGNTNYDGAPIVITNCTVTIDGAHTFASLDVQAGGVLTHSQRTNGLLENLLSIQEFLSLTGNVAVALSYPDVVAGSVLVQDEVGRITYVESVDYKLDTNTPPVTLIYRTDASTIPDGATVKVSYQAMGALVACGLALTVAGDALIEAGGSVNADAAGYGSDLGYVINATNLLYGAGLAGGGGGHGGQGVAVVVGTNGTGGLAYDVFVGPALLGSGGGSWTDTNSFTRPGGIGGGNIHLDVGGTLLVDGTVSANGQGTNDLTVLGGGGAGGSIWLTATNFAGAGIIEARGGNAGTECGGGGGGRIFISCQTNAFSGQCAAPGGLSGAGAGKAAGGAGTVAIQNADADPSLLVNNEGVSGEVTPARGLSLSSLEVSGGGQLKQDYIADQPDIPWTATSLLVASNSWVIIASQSLSVSGDGMIEQGAGITGDGTGWWNGMPDWTNDPGAGGTVFSITNPPTASGGGGGHGGYGAASPLGATGGKSHGSAGYPRTRGGSGGGWSGQGGRGGGAVELNVGGALTVAGSISANGSGYPQISEWGGGGAGGSILITCSNLSGAGSLRANGGDAGALGGAGGGGRIAVYWQTNAFSGVVEARGGTGPQNGGAGTVYLQPGYDSGLLLVDNNGVAGAGTTVSGVTSNTDFVIQGRAWVGGTVYPPVRNLLIASNSWLAANNQTLTITSNAVVPAGAAIRGDGAGYGAGLGPGAGRLSIPPYVGSGGGYGGIGGASYYSSVAGGIFYGTIAAPGVPGSGGGGTTNSPAAGGAGGGLVRLVITGDLLLDGSISCNGLAAASTNGGGGSGGSVWITAHRVVGAGTITVNGGDGRDFGGGGSGGRIAVTVSEYQTGDFAGSLSARGGLGYGQVNADFNGGAGTILCNLEPSATNRVVVDNGGFKAGKTPLVGMPLARLEIKGGGVAIDQTPLPTLSGLLVAGGSSLLVTNKTITVTGDALIQTGAVVTCNGFGGLYGTGRGNTSGSPISGSGAGHGGVGGNSSSNVLGGISYGSAINPTTTGSGGGGTVGPSPYLPGLGGGALKLSVSGSLEMDGTISANGTVGKASRSGGGSGGSVWLDIAGAFRGNGRISADGGAGEPIHGGGGAGGRVAVYHGTSEFTGTYSVQGGGGANAGGAGTLYLKPASSSVGQLIINNNGLAGTNTPLGSIPTVDLTLASGARALMMGGLPVIRNLVLQSNSWLIVSNVTLKVTGDATIAQGAGISANGFGALPGSGAGFGQSLYLNGTYTGGGGGHGGLGSPSLAGAQGGVGFDSVSTPVILGSGGGGPTGNPAQGGNGGGLINITVDGTLTLDGTISANGVKGYGQGGGGGAGGTVILRPKSLLGTGRISADGGDGNGWGGGGGGGRIAVFLNSYSNEFAGSFSAAGGLGGGGVAGGAGTIFRQLGGLTPLLVADNGGRSGTNTYLYSPPVADVDVGNGAVVPIQSVSINSLTVRSNGAVLLTNSLVTIYNDCQLLAGGRLVSDGAGWGGGTGIGAGQFLSTTNAGGGGGHGGNGSLGRGGAAGGIIHDSTTSPTAAGGGGGGTGIYAGGNGGGIIQLRITRDLLVDGSISANGLNGIGSGGGGGAGGSVFLTANSILGSGSITADGGAGNGAGGGGGGGRVALVATGFTNLFAGTITARGGAGGVGIYGGAGTIYRAAAAAMPALEVNNGGRFGTNTGITPLGSVSLLLGGGANLGLNYSPQLGSLVIASNAWLWTSNQAVNVQGDAVIQAGCGISASGSGFVAGAGTGAGQVTTYLSTTSGGGGGHGGYGSASYGGAMGGTSYGSATVPTTWGSGGGGSYSPALGGKGGGSVRLTVNGALTLDGSISANGQNAVGLGGGGGAGGSVWLTLRSFSGAGTISANGGNGQGWGGGGGGGRIAVDGQLLTNSFAGTVQAFGGLGGGTQAGGAGTAYLKGTGGLGDRLFVDNGGVTGTRTILPPIPAVDLSAAAGANIWMYPTNTYLRSLWLGAGAQLSPANRPGKVWLTVYQDAVINGNIMADGWGYSRGAEWGPGPGFYSPSLYGWVGSGGGHGGRGGNSSVTLGGMTNDSPTQPTLGGSVGGGNSSPGGEGGGAIQLFVGGRLIVDGKLSANGMVSMDDNGGGGAGGSIWVQTLALAGSGMITAAGADGELFGGGGGGGGRIALYAPSNSFTGLLTAAGGLVGFLPGEYGTIYQPGSLPPFIGISSYPSGTFTAAQGGCSAYFNSPVDITSVSAEDLALITPAGPLDPTNIWLASVIGSSASFGFVAQTNVGDYTFLVGPNITDIWGQPMSQVLTGAFTLASSFIAGVAADTNGAPVAGVVLSNAVGGFLAQTDTNGAYAFEVSPGASLTVVPHLGGQVFVPSARSYTNIDTSWTNENYLVISSVTPVATTTVSGTNLTTSWYGIQGVQYQILFSEDLVQWFPYGGTLGGTNGPIEFSVPMDASAGRFFRLQAIY